MHNLITTINFGSVNCYLLQSNTSYILIDNGYPAKCAYLEKELERAGCKPGNLKLVVLTQEFCDNLADFNASSEKLKSLKINTFYPGHGKPFTLPR